MVSLPRRTTKKRPDGRPAQRGQRSRRERKGRERDCGAAGRTRCAADALRPYDNNWRVSSWFAPTEGRTWVFRGETPAVCGGKSAWAPTGFLRSRQNPKPSKVCPVNATAYNNRRRRRHGYRASRPNTREYSRGRAEFSTEIITSIAENFCRNESGASENFAIR